MAKCLPDCECARHAPRSFDLVCDRCGSDFQGRVTNRKYCDGCVEAARYEQDRDRRLLLRYGIDGNWVADQLEKQGGLCPICEDELVKPHVDHDHRTGMPRFLLCFRCNTLLGLIEEDVELLEAARQYILAVETLRLQTDLDLWTAYIGQRGRV